MAKLADIQMQVMWNRLVSVVEEQAQTLVRTAFGAATREAGLTGGGNALDGLVRSFIGAGGRSVIASHWPAPDDFDATKRLIGGLFATSEGTSVADALWATQMRLMDDKQTSHPYYWAGFAIIGDGGQALLHNGGAVAKNGEAATRAAR